METTRLDFWMPTYDFVSRHEAGVGAPAEVVYASLRRADFASSRLVRVLFALRGLGGGRFTLDDLVRAGFTVLDDVAGEEIVLGIVGKFWRPAGSLVRVGADEFADFDRPGFVAAAWNFNVTTEGAGSRLATETRIRATDAAARRAFARYWRAVGPFSGLIRRRVLALVARDAEAAVA
ncbi:MAG TPA: hypothetical protein VM784_07030 [Actinomycetota bacterium]|nr:hypothetical protein [Actinomycetota bacterium]